MSSSRCDETSLSHYPLLMNKQTIELAPPWQQRGLGLNGFIFKEIKEKIKYKREKKSRGPFRICLKFVFTDQSYSVGYF